ncbi:MAG: VWA domain-containing protein [Lachnospiraceae bacterium]|nr:VWA domain-containing protein [Lachnospiraceae bacterium]
MKKRIYGILLATTMGITALNGCGGPGSKVECRDTSPTTVSTTPYYPAEVYEAPRAASKSTEASGLGSLFTTDAECIADSNGYYYEYNEPFTGETYELISESGFLSVGRSPLSTFGADVDTASYSNMRRFVNAGYGLYDFENVALRTEELINYFNYNYKAPGNGEKFGVESSVSDCPWNKKNKLLVLGINTKNLTEGKRPASNIVFLIDVSGSMNSADKLPLLKDSMKLLVENLTKDDRVSIVTYASGTGVVLDSVKGTETRKINKAFDSLKASGSTNGEGGIELAYEIAEKNFIEGGNNRIILATDGDFNVGKHRGDELKELISEKKDSGVFLSILGFGTGNYNDVTGETLADSGNGNYSYIDCLTEAKKVLVDEMSSTLYTVAKDTKFQVEFNPETVLKYRLIGYENRALEDKDFTDDTKDGGELGAGHQVTVIYELELAEDAPDIAYPLKYQSATRKNAVKEKRSNDWCTLSIAYKDPDKDESQYLEFPVGEEKYTETPTDDFMLATSVAEYAMALNASEFLVDLTREEALDQAIKNVKKLNLDDELVKEFLTLMQKVAGNESNPGSHWYD